MDPRVMTIDSGTDVTMATMLEQVCSAAGCSHSPSLVDMQPPAAYPLEAFGLTHGLEQLATIVHGLNCLVSVLDCASHRLSSN